MSRKCKNCEEELLGDYCHRCGQSAFTGRLTMRYFSHELVYSFTHADRRGLFFTLKGLFTRPGYMLREYILGHRINYFKPFPLLIILAGLCGLINHFVDKRAIEEEKAASSQAVVQSLEVVKDNLSVQRYDSLVTAGKTAPSHKPISQTANTASAEKLSDHKDIPVSRAIWDGLSKWAKDHQLIFALLFLLPLFAFSLKIAFRRVGITRFNYAECLYVSAYIFCQLLIIRILFFPLDFFGETGGNLFLLLFFVFLIWMFRQFFDISFLQAFWRTVWLGVVLFGVFTAAVVIIALCAAIPLYFMKAT